MFSLKNHVKTCFATFHIASVTPSLLSIFVCPYMYGASLNNLLYMPEPPTETVNHGDIQHFGIPAFHPSKHIPSTTPRISKKS